MPTSRRLRPRVAKDSRRQPRLALSFLSKKSAEEIMWKKLAAAALCTMAFGAAAAQAEVNEIRMSKQFGLPYLPMIVIEAQQLIEKNTKAELLRHSYFRSEEHTSEL